MIPNIVNEIIEKELKKMFPSSRQNNSRSIVRGAVERFKRSPSDSNQVNVENMTGWVGDHLDSDYRDEDLIIKEN